MKGLYAAFRFLFEITTIVCIGVWGLRLQRIGPWRYVVGIAACAIVIIIWARWGAPSAANRLQGIPHLLLEVGIYSAATACLYFSGSKQWAIVYAIAGIANAVVHHLWLPSL